MNFLTQIRNKIQNFLVGRNGVDILSRDLSLFGLILMILDLFTITHIIYWIGVLFLIISIFRICSRNITKRSAENSFYFTKRSKFINWFKNKKKHMSSKKHYRYYNCTSCNQKVRVPKGKGKIQITCPKCGFKFIKKT